MVRMFLAALSALVLGLAPPAAAQETPAPGVSDPAAIEAAREMLRAMNFESQVVQITEQTTEATVTSIIQAFQAEHGRPFPAELEADFRVIVREHNQAVLAEIAPTMLDSAALLYARYFSLEEIRELHRIQTHPVMLKLQRILPQFVAESSQMGVPEAVRRLPELRARIAEALERWLESESRNWEGPPA